MCKFYEEQIKEIIQSLSINKSQLALILGVSRSIVYSWLETSIPDTETRQRLTKLIRILNKAEINSLLPLNSRFVRHTVLENEKPILDYLKDKELNENNIVKLLNQAKILTKEATDNIEKRKKKYKELGFKEPTFEEAKRNINYILYDTP